MKRPSSYNTRQREAILGYISTLESAHFTAAEVAGHFQAQGSPIGLTTIYRQLDRLVSQGLVTRYLLDGSSGACYQYNRPEEHSHDPHYHLKCQQCGSLLHLSCGQMELLEQHIRNSHGFKLDWSKTVFYGDCANCGK